MHKPVYPAARRALYVTPLLLLCALPLWGCGGGNGNAVLINYKGDGTSGARGTAYLQNADGTKTPFANSKVAATIYVCPPSGYGIPCTTQDVVTAQTDAQGNFTLPLAPGTYGFAFTYLPNAVVYPLTSGLSITVLPHQFTSITPIGATFQPTTQ